MVQQCTMHKDDAPSIGAEQKDSWVAQQRAVQRGRHQPAGARQRARVARHGVGGGVAQRQQRGNERVCAAACQRSGCDSRVNARTERRGGRLRVRSLRPARLLRGALRQRRPACAHTRAVAAPSRRPGGRTAAARRASAARRGSTGTRTRPAARSARRPRRRTRRRTRAAVSPPPPGPRQARRPARAQSSSPASPPASGPPAAPAGLRATGLRSARDASASAAARAHPLRAAASARPGPGCACQTPSRAPPARRGA